ncbi:MAG: YtfJ family protein [Candidatus Neomarinimicrobiota bacterium]
MKKLLIVLLTVLCLTAFAFADALEIGKKPAELVLDGKDGGRLDNTPWSSQELEKTAWVVFYVDPDESDLNVAAEDALDAMDYSKKELLTAAVINYKGTNLPNFAINIALRNKQKKHPGALYLADKKHVLVEKWGLTDDTYCTLVFDKNGILRYRYDGKMDEAEIAKYLKAVKESI